VLSSGAESLDAPIRSCHNLKSLVAQESLDRMHNIPVVIDDQDAP
jgi:hypothetical protein